MPALISTRRAAVLGNSIPAYALTTKAGGPLTSKAGAILTKKAA